jgi:hypothetical protein
MKKTILILGVVSMISGVFAGAQLVKPGADLQAVLDSGVDLVLKPGCVYDISEALVYKKAGQKIFTSDARLSVLVPHPF